MIGGHRFGVLLRLGWIIGYLILLKRGAIDLTSFIGSSVAIISVICVVYSIATVISMLPAALHLHIEYTKIRPPHPHYDDLPSILALEGPIAIGKSTLCAEFERLTDRKFHVVYEKINQNFLRSFYQDPAKYAFAFQLHTMLARTQEINRMLFTTRDRPLQGQVSVSSSEYPQPITVLDRSIIGDLAFALTQYFSGRFDDQQLTNYMTLLVGEDTEHPPFTTLERMGIIIYLHAQPTRCRDSAASRGGTDASIPLNYHEMLSDVYFYIMLWFIANTNMKIHVFDWERFGTAEQILSALSSTAAMNGNRAQATFAGASDDDGFDMVVRAIPTPIRANVTNTTKTPEVSSESSPRFTHFHCSLAKKRIIDELKTGKKILLQPPDMARTMYETISVVLSRHLLTSIAGR